VLSTPTQRGLADQATESLGPLARATFAGARLHVPTDKVDAACRALDEAGADGCVAVGGGSTVGLAKAVALLTGLPYVAVPTTDAGSEMTPLWGLTDSNRKRTGRDAESTAAHRNLRSRPHLRPSVIGF
jgi:maleylacetate reductase